MREFDDYNDLFNYLDESINNSLDELAELFKQTLFTFVKENFYDVYEPELYKRTWEVLNSISLSQKYQEGGMTTIDIFFDTSKIHPKLSTFPIPKGMRRYHHHIDISGNPTNDIIVYILNDGYRFGQSNSKIRKSGKFLQAIDKWSKNKHNWLWKLKEILNTKGIDIEI